MFIYKRRLAKTTEQRFKMKEYTLNIPSLIIMIFH